VAKLLSGRKNAARRVQQSYPVRAALALLDAGRGGRQPTRTRFLTREGCTRRCSAARQRCGCWRRARSTSAVSRH